MPLTKAHLTNRQYLSAYIGNKWGNQPVLIQLTRELYNDDSKVTTPYYITVLTKNTSLVTTQLSFDYAELITMNKATYQQMMARLSSGAGELGWHMTVQQFLNGMITRKEIIDEILAEL